MTIYDVLIVADNVPVYDRAFYDDILAKRRALGDSEGFVDLDKCAEYMRRAMSDTEEG